MPPCGSPAARGFPFEKAAGDPSNPRRLLCTVFGGRSSGLVTLPDGDDDLGDVLLLVVDVDGGDNVLLGDGPVHGVALLVEPLDGLHVGLDDLVVPANVQGRHRPEAAELLKLRRGAHLVDLDADLQVAVPGEELLQGVIVVGEDDGPQHPELLLAGHLEELEPPVHGDIGILVVLLDPPGVDHRGLGDILHLDLHIPFFLRQQSRFTGWDLIHQRRLDSQTVLSPALYF